MHSDVDNRRISSPYRVLLITYDFYPDTSPNTYRWKNVLEDWAKKGVEVFVVAAQKDNLPKFEKINGINVYRTGMSWLEKVKVKLLKKITSNDINTHNLKMDVSKQSAIRKFYDVTWKKLYFPDFAFLWRYPSQKLAEKIIQDKNINNLITVSWPFTDHVVGYKLKKKYKINWIADTIDPFYLSKAVNNGFLYGKKNYSYEYKILKQANFITLLTEKLKRKYIELYPELADKLYVNHNLFVPENKNSTQYEISADICKLVFVGTLSRITRPPEFLLKLFVQLIKRNTSNKLELHLYGYNDDCKSIFLEYSEYLNSFIFIHGEIPREKVKKIFLEANVLINIGNSNPYQEPSKIIEYMFMLKPILNVCTISDDSSAHALKEYPLKFDVYPNDFNDQVADAILDFLTTNDVADELLVKKLTSKYMLSEVQNCYFKLLSNNVDKIYKNAK